MVGQPRPGGSLLTATRARRLVLALPIFLYFCSPLCGQNPGSSTPDAISAYGVNARAVQSVTIDIGVRDSRGLPLEDKASVRLVSRLRNYDRTVFAEKNSTASFTELLEGPYDVEVRCPGYRPAIEHLDVIGGAAFFSAYVYLRTESEPDPVGRPSKGLVLTPKLAGEIDRGLASMRKHDYEAAKIRFTKAARLAPTSSDVTYLLGTAEKGLQHTDAARQDFEQAIALDPSNDKALLALGEIQLQSGDLPGAIKTLGTAYATNGGSWRTLYLLASAYAKSGDLANANKFAARSVNLAHATSAVPLLLLGDIQAARGEWPDARQTWARVETECPSCPEAADARKKITDASGSVPGLPEASSTSFTPLAASPELPASIESRPWAPLDIDSKDYPVAPDAACNTDEVIPRAMRRMKSQLENLEKFGATEHIEHQEIDKNGNPGPLKTHDFYYLVFVIPQKNDSVFLEETRDGGRGVTQFPTSLATTGLDRCSASTSCNPSTAPVTIIIATGLPRFAVKPLGRSVLKKKRRKPGCAPLAALREDLQPSPQGSPMVRFHQL